MGSPLGPEPRAVPDGNGDRRGATECLFGEDRLGAAATCRFPTLLPAAMQHRAARGGDFEASDGYPGVAEHGLLSFRPVESTIRGSYWEVFFFFFSNCSATPRYLH